MHNKKRNIILLISLGIVLFLCISCFSYLFIKDLNSFKIVDVTNKQRFKQIINSFDRREAGIYECVIDDEMCFIISEPVNKCSDADFQIDDNTLIIRYDSTTEEANLIKIYSVKNFSKSADTIIAFKNGQQSSIKCIYILDKLNQIIEIK